MKLKLLAIALPLLWLTSCTVSFISKYDEAVKTEVKAGQSMTERAYSEAIANLDKSFAANEPTYKMLSAQITSLKGKEAARPKSKLLVAMVNEIEKAYNNAVAFHKRKGVLNEAELTQFKDALNMQWKSLLNAENNLPKN